MSDPGAGPLVTVLGATGYLGSAVSAVLAARPLRLRLVGRTVAERPPVTRPGCRAVPADLARPGETARAVTGSDVVVHLLSGVAGTRGWRALPGDEQSLAVEAGPLRELLGLVGAPGGPRALVLASTAALNAAVDAPTGYERHLRRAEALVLGAAARGPWQGTCLRLPTLYGVSAAAGPGWGGRGAVRALVGQALAGGPVTVWGDGSNLRNLVHVDDAAHAVALAVRHVTALSGRYWDVGAPRSLPLRELATAVASSVGRVTGRPEVPVVTIPPPPTATSHDLADAVVDAGPFARVTGWRPGRDLSDSLDETVRALAHDTTTRGA